MRKSAILSSVFVILALAIATRAQRSKCGPGRFECGDGECINGDKVCDGSADCRDGSDETEAECSKPEYMCPAYAFRCAYGACVDGDAPCNGKRDCVDNSDETLPRCLAGGGGGGGPSGSERRECARNEFKCNNGQCVPSSALCDGRTDCADKSDETTERCSELTCIEFLFRCNYGACVDGDAKCNGINDCADGSDEDPSLCRVQPGPVSPPTRTPPSGVSPTPPHRPAQFCPAPGQPPNGKRQLHRSLCPGRREECDVNEGTPIEPGNYLVYTCDAGYKLTGPSNVFCDAQGMWLNIPACIEIRCPSLNSASTQAHCIYRNKDGPCDNPVLPGTRAILSCRTSYQEDTKLLSSQRQVECNERGLWEPEPIRCYPVCGVIYANARPLIVNGMLANISDFPWHATLYKEEVAGGPKEFICGATIVKNNILLTAAHCVYNETTHRLNDPSSYHIVTGNVYRDYDSEHHDQRIVRKARVKSIHIPCEYSGYLGNFKADIAVIEIATPFSYTSRLLPICLDTIGFGDRFALVPNQTGKVAGFGGTALGVQSYVLLTIDVPYVPQTECKISSAQYKNLELLTLDKFCAGYTNGTSVCDGDSGGGLVFKTGDLWYIRGIVSSDIGIDRNITSCNVETYSLYTRVADHMTWIQEVIYNLETYQYYRPC